MSFLFGLWMILLAWSLGFFVKDDIEALQTYQQLMSKKSSEERSPTTTLHRSEVSKQYLVSMDGKRQDWRMASPSSDISLVRASSGEHLKETMHEVTGSTQSVNQQGAGNITANSFEWDGEHNTLTLTGNVFVQLDSKLQVKTPNTLMLTRGNGKGQPSVRKIECPSSCEIIYQDQTHQLEHRIQTHGKMVIDFETGQGWMDSPKDEAGNVLSDQQIFLENQMGEISANDLHLTLGKESDNFMPTKINFDGDVRMLNRFNGHVKESASALQQALADHLEWIPADHLILLTSDNKNRVLFFDKVNNMQMSAPSLRIIQPHGTHKGSIQGLGDVRFTFLNQEVDLLQKRFQFNPPSP